MAKHTYRVRFEDGDTFALPLGVPRKAAENTAKNYSERRNTIAYLDQAPSMNRGLSRGEYTNIGRYESGRKVAVEHGAYGKHGFRAGQRVQLHPATDQWMMGDRYGTVSKPSWKGGVLVKMDRSGKSLKCKSEHLLQVD